MFVGFSNNLVIESLMIIFIASQVYALLIVAHDGLHRRLFNEVKKNDFFNDLLVLGSVGAITRINRHNHMLHHENLATPNDPDRFKYVKNTRSNHLDFLISITCIPTIWKAVYNVFRKKRSSSGLREKYQIRDVFLIVGWQLGLLALLSNQIGWYGYLAYWLVPVIIALCLDMVRVFCEHSDTTSGLEADLSKRLHSFDSNWVEKQILAPNNMNHHIAHHLWVGIPYYNLPKAERLIKDRLSVTSDLTWRSSYFGYMFGFWKALSNRDQRLS